MYSKSGKHIKMNQSSSKNLKNNLESHYIWLQNIRISWKLTKWRMPGHTICISSKYQKCSFNSCQSCNWSKRKHKWKEHKTLKCKLLKDFLWTVSLLYIVFLSSTELYFAPWIVGWKCFWKSSLKWQGHSSFLFTLDHFQTGLNSQYWSLSQILSIRFCQFLLFL